MESAVRKRTKGIGPNEFQEKGCLIRGSWPSLSCYSPFAAAPVNSVGQADAAKQVLEARVGAEVINP